MGLTGDRLLVMAVYPSAAWLRKGYALPIDNILPGWIPAALVACVRFPVPLLTWPFADVCYVTRFLGLEIDRGKPAFIYGLNVHSYKSASSFLYLVDKFLSSVVSPPFYLLEEIYE